MGHLKKCKINLEDLTRFDKMFICILPLLFDYLLEIKKFTNPKIYIIPSYTDVSDHAWVPSTNVQLPNLQTVLLLRTESCNDAYI